MADKVVYDMSVYSETSTTIFAAKSWVAIQDNMNGSYSGGQSVVETSSISNSDKWANYREAYLSIPLIQTLTSVGDGVNATGIRPRNDATTCDYAVGLKNWFGSIIHSFTCDVGGVTRIQQTPYQSLWNTFKLMSSLSYDDLLTQGPSIGFYPDTSIGVNFQNAFAQAGNAAAPVAANQPKLAVILNSGEASIA